MKLISWLKYFVYALLVFCVLFLNAFILGRFKVIQSTTYTISFVLLSVTILINMILGALLGVEHLLSEKRKAGHWKLNLPKMLFLALPFLFFSLTYILYYSEIVRVI